MLREEAGARTISTKRKATVSPGTTRTRQNKKKSKVDPPILLKKKELIRLDGNICEVMGRAGKANGIHRNRYNLRKTDSDEPEFAVNLEDKEFERIVISDKQQVLMVGQEQEVLMQTIPYHLHGNQECMEAKRVELEKIVEQFNAVEEVEDKGQFRISTRWVMWYKKTSDGAVQTPPPHFCRG